MNPKAREILPAGDEHTPAWYQTRANGIGGSDIASIVGVGYRSAYAIWLDKTQPETREDTGTLQMSRGHALEPIVASEFEAATELTATQTGTWQRTDKPHHIANPDRFVSDGGGLEIKCTSSLTMGMYWTDETPRYSAELQAQWCMHVTGIDHWWIAAWCWEKPLQVYRLDRDPETIAWIASEADDMWERVQNNNPPDVDSHPTTGEALTRRWSPHMGESVDNEDWELIHHQYRALNAQKREVEKNIDLMKHQVMSGMGEATEATACGTPVATWRPDKNGRRRFAWARLGSRTETNHPAETRVRDLPRMIDSPLPPKLSTGGAPPPQKEGKHMPIRTETVAWTETESTTGVTIRQGAIRDEISTYIPVLNPRETGGEHIGYCTQIVEDDNQIKATVDISDDLANQLDTGERVLLLDVKPENHSAIPQKETVIAQARASSIVVAKRPESAWPQHHE